MLASRLPQSTCGFASTRRPSSAVASPSSSLLPTVVEVSHSADTTPAHLFICCCSSKTRLANASPPVNSSASNCCSPAFSVHRSSHMSSSSSSVSSPTLTTFRPGQYVNVTCHRTSLPHSNDSVQPSSLSPVCCNECRQSSISDSSSSFPPPPPPLPPSFIDVTVSCTSPYVSCMSPELTSSRESITQPSLTAVAGHHTPCIGVHTQLMNILPPPPPPPPPPPGLVPFLVPPPPIPPPGFRHGPSGQPPSNSVCGRTPRTKLRRLQWHKIPDSRVRAVGSDCVWAHVQRQLKSDSEAPCLVDLERVEELFAVGSSSGGGNGMTRPKSGPATLAMERRKSEQVELFDSRRSLNIGIFLRQFRSSNAYEELVGGLSTADSESIGAERLRALLKSLPDDDEMGKVLSYSGDPSRLGPAEKFCRDLATALPNYRLRIEALLLKEEFNQTVDWLKPSIDAVIISARDLRNCCAIRDILGTVLLVGNFLNTGAYTGCAAGFQLQSLHSLRDLRANGGRLSLLHFIVTEVEKRNPGAIAEIREMKFIKEAAQCHIETITADIAALRDKLRRISSQFSGSDDAFRLQMESFIEFAGEELSELESDVTELESLRVELAAYFCEDEKTFQLDECIRQFSTFFDSFVRASQENHDRHVLEEKAEERRRLRAQQMNAKQHSRQRTLEDSSNHVEDGRSCGTQLQQSASSAVPVSEGAESGNGNQHRNVCRNASTGDLGGHADVTTSSSAPPLRSVSSAAALRTHMRSQPTTTADDSDADENTASDGDLLNCLLRVAGTTAGGGGADGSGLALRRRRRSNATDLDVVIRERTSSPVCFSDLGQRMVGRRRSLPTPRPTVRDIAVSLPGCTVKPCSADAPESCSGTESFSDSAENSTTAGVRKDQCCLSDIDENAAITTSSTSAVPDNNATTEYVVDSSEVDKSAVDISSNQDQEAVDNAINGQTSTENTFSSTTAVDAVQQNVSDVTDESVLRQTQSTVNIDGEQRSSAWLLRRSQSLKLYRYRDRSAVRGELESQQLDTNVHEFHARAAPEREALRNRLRKLSLIYATTTDQDETSRTWPASRRPCAGGDEGHGAPTTVPGEIPLRCGDNVSASSSSTSTLQLKYDTDSLSSQKDEGFETASISSDVYLSSSQRSSMCDCDAALTTPSSLERRGDPATTKTTHGTSEPQPDILPPPPPSFLDGPELVETDIPRSGGENSFAHNTENVVLTRSKQESAKYDAEQHLSSNKSLSVVSTPSIRQKRLNETKAESGRGGPPRSVKNATSVRQTSQTVGTRQTKVARPAPATPSRGSSLVSSSASRNTSSVRTTAAVTNTQAAVKPSTRPPSSAALTTSTSGQQVPFQRSSPLRATDDRKLSSRDGGAPIPSSSPFVRQSQTRATIAAPVLRTNKRAAAEARKLKAASASQKTVPTSTAQASDSSSSRLTTITPSTSSGVVSRFSNRSSSNGSCSSTSSANAGPKSASFRTASSGTATIMRQPAAPVNVPVSSSKKPSSSAASSSLSVPSKLRHSMQPSNSRLRAPLAAAKKHCS